MFASRCPRPWLSVLLALACASCAPGPPHGAQMTHTPDPSLPKCAGAPVGCITTPSCQYDEKHQCEACVCSPVMASPAQMQAAPFRTP